MTVKMCKAIVGSLAHSQGLYGRLWNHLESNRLWGKFARAATKAKCRNTLDLVLWIEQ